MLRRPAKERWRRSNSLSIHALALGHALRRRHVARGHAGSDVLEVGDAAAMVLKLVSVPPSQRVLM
jgi:hypothetical protein